MGLGQSPQAFGHGSAGVRLFALVTRERVGRAAPLVIPPFLSPNGTAVSRRLDTAVSLTLRLGPTLVVLSRFYSLAPILTPKFGMTHVFVI